MLTNDLVRASVRKGEVRPSFIDPTRPEHLSLAKSLLEIFQTHQGLTREALQGELVELLGTGTEFLLHRGLAKLLFDRCSFDVQAAMEPQELRWAVFSASAAAHRREEEHQEGQGPSFDRDRVIEEVATSLSLTTDQIHRSLYADLKDQQILKKFKDLTAPALLMRYNTAQAQAVLLRARSLTLEIRSQPTARYRALFRKIKFFQLLHRVEPLDEGYRIHLDGPLSMFKASTRYGLQMANFLPTLLHFQGWELTAQVLWGRHRKEYILRLSPKNGLKPYNRLTGQWQPQELTFLPEQLARLDCGWEVSTEAELLPLGNQGILVPDYVFTHPASGRRVLMEVFGFWNKGAIASRLELLRQHGPDNLILAMSRSLASGAENLEDLPSEIYQFRTAPVARQVVKLLKGFEG
ncbi:MAG: DUF790 family protein [Deltaproteobacteria bacterium]|nr:DUF790 family protein [Deltaproteobacteria bacterium]